MYQKIDRFMKKINNDDVSRFLDGVDFSINGFGRYEQGNVSELRSFISSDYELIYLRSGSTMVEWGGGSAEATPGSFLLLEPYHEYSAVCVSDERVYYFYIHFDIKQEYMRDIYYNRMINKGAPVFDAVDMPDFAVIFADALEDRINGREGLNIALRALLTLFSVRMMRIRKSNGVYDDVGVDKQEMSCITDMQRLIEENGFRPITVSQICRELGTSESYLYKLFMKVLNQSPSRFISQQRLKKAEQMIKLEGCSVSNTAAILGYSSAAHLSGLFKKNLGKSPTELLKRSIEN